MVRSTRSLCRCVGVLVGVLVVGTLGGCGGPGEETEGDGTIGLTIGVSASASDGATGSTDPTDGSSSGIGGDPECPYSDPGGDEDGDGVANDADICPCEEDAAQRDFDADGRGDVCDNALLYAVTEGEAPANLLKTLVIASTTVEVLGQTVEAACEFEIPMLATGGEVLVRLGASDRAGLWLARLDFANTGVRECNIAALGVEIVHLKVELTDLTIEGTEPYAVGFPFNPGDHAAGRLEGEIDGPQPIAIYGNFVVLESDNENLSAPGTTELSGIPGDFARGAVTVSESGERFATDWSDPDFVVFDQVVSESGVRVQLVGMDGLLKLRR